MFQMQVGEAQTTRFCGIVEVEGKGVGTSFSGCGASRWNRIAENRPSGEAGQCNRQRVRARSDGRRKAGRMMSVEGYTTQLFARKVVT